MLKLPKDIRPAHGWDCQLFYNWEAQPSRSFSNRNASLISAPMISSDWDSQSGKCPAWIASPSWVAKTDQAFWLYQQKCWMMLNIPWNHEMFEYIYIWLHMYRCVCVWYINVIRIHILSGISRHNILYPTSSILWKSSWHGLRAFVGRRWIARIAKYKLSKVSKIHFTSSSHP